MQAASAFTIVQGAFNWLVDNYPPACGLDRVGQPRVLFHGVHGEFVNPRKNGVARAVL